MLGLLCLSFVVGALGAPSSSCPTACDTEYKPVCGSNGATYSETFRPINTRIKEQKTATIQSESKSAISDHINNCPNYINWENIQILSNNLHDFTINIKETNRSSPDSPPQAFHQQRSRLSHGHTTFVSCPCSFTGNACELGIASCQSLLQGRPRIYESYSGRCSPQLDDPIRCDMICDDQDVKTPICASDGVVYDTKCRFNLAYCAAFENGHLLSIVSNSNTCPGPREPDCEKYAFNTTDPLGSSRPCSSTLQRICTTDGPFDNECDFCSFLDGMMDRWPNFKVAGHKIQYDGRCHDYFPGIQVGK